MQIGFLAETEHSFFTTHSIVGLSLIAIAVVAFILTKIANVNEKFKTYLEMLSLVVGVVGLIIELYNVINFQSNVVPPIIPSSNYTDSYTESDTESDTQSYTKSDNPFESLYVGKTISFGNYTGEDIDWKVMEINESEKQALLLSVYNVECVKFNDNGRASWGNSDLRTWLNNSFFWEAFSSEDTSDILLSNIVTNADEITTDKLFVLSRNEIRTFFPSAQSRCTGTFSSARAQSDCDQYWLRDSGQNLRYAYVVRTNGTIEQVTTGTPWVNVRPAMWVRIP